MRWWELAVLAWGVALSGCAGTDSFVCGADEQCSSGGAGGVCEDNGFCSFPDASCESGRRFGDAAPATVAGRCVESESGSTGTGLSTSTSGTAGASTDGPTSSTTTGTTEAVSMTATESSTTGTSQSTSSEESSDASTTGSSQCPTQPDAQTVALYNLDSMVSVPDAVGGHDGSWHSGGPTLVDGPVGCGMATAFDGASTVVIPDDPDFHLARGSFDVWVRLGAPLSAGSGLVTRDADGADAEGHLSLWYGAGGRISVRHQGLMDPSSDQLVCSDDVVAQDTWIHVGVNFGQPVLQLYIDGQSQGGTGTTEFLGAVRDCLDGATAFGIDGNDNPWHVGASGASSAEGGPDPVGEYFIGALDELRISSQRRDFANGE